MNIKDIESVVRLSANRVGIDIHRYRPEDSMPGRVARMLEFKQVDLVLDVGANVGQYARDLRRGGYRQRIVSFEPLDSAWSLLSRNAAGDPLWEVAPRGAVGDCEQEIQIHVARNSVSSSILPMLDQHRMAAPESAYVATQTAPMARLDRLAAPYLTAATIPFIKIDTQGYERQVIAGATALLEGAAIGVQLEMSLVPLYEGQSLFEPMLDQMRRRGFELWGVWPGFSEPRSGRMLQVDVVLMRADATPPSGVQDGSGGHA